MKDPRVQAMLKRSRHKNLSVFVIGQDYYELPKKSIRANGTFYHIFKPEIFRELLNTHLDKSSIDMTLNEFKLLTSTCWNINYQPLTIDMTKDKYAGQYRLGLIPLFVPDSSLFQIN